MTYQHFTIEEREKTQEMLWQKSSIRTIAGALGRSPSSVSREIRRNKPPEHNQYTPRLAHKRALNQRKRRGRTERLKNDILRAHTISHLEARLVSGANRRHRQKIYRHQHLSWKLFISSCTPKYTVKDAAI